MFSRKKTYEQWAEDEDPGAVVLRQEDLFAKVGWRHAHNYILL